MSTLSVSASTSCRICTRSSFPRASRCASRSRDRSKWSTIARLPPPVTITTSSIPDAIASSTPYWIVGLSTSGSISFGCAFVTGRKRVPNPAAGNTALRTVCAMAGWYLRAAASRYRIYSMLDPAYVRDHLEEVRAGLRTRGLQPDAELEQVATVEAQRRRLIPELEGLKREQNA